jgi:hypothetical protein
MKIFPYEHAIPLTGIKIFPVRMRSKPLTKISRNAVALHVTIASMAATNSEKKRKNFRWNSDMIEVLIDSLMEYKTQMSYKGIDFDGDKPMQYKEIRLMMAKIYSEDISIFGPLSVDQLPDGFNEMSKEEKDEAKELVKISKELIAKGTKRVMEKVKEIRQAFSKAVISGTRSGSGKIVFEFYDKLVLLWGGSANVTPLTYGVGSNDFEQECDLDQDEQLQDTFNEQDVDDFSNATTLSLELDVSALPDENDNTEETEAGSAMSANKRKANCVPQLIDNKRKQLSEIKCYLKRLKKMQNLEKT